MSESQRARETARKVKCVVWDLDNTLWEGVLLEGGGLRVRGEVADIIKALDGRGILHSVASRNDEAAAMAKLKEVGLLEYFLYPQIAWRSKSASIRMIAEQLNIGQDSLAFIDDDPFERQEVRFSLPDVLCIDSANLGGLLEMPEMIPNFITEDSRRRRQMYVSDLQRKKIEEEFAGPKEEFLASLNMIFTISKAQEGDLQRAEELTLRTNQLNTTGYTYSYEELDAFRKSEDHLLLVAGLEDKFGSYGKIGLGLVEKLPDYWMIKLLLMSCRVMSRGVGTVLLNQILLLARQHGVRVLSEFISNGRNRMMYVSYKFANFTEVERRGDVIVLENRAASVPAHPDYIRVHLEGLQDGAL